LFKLGVQEVQQSGLSIATKIVGGFKKR